MFKQGSALLLSLIFFATVSMAADNPISCSGAPTCKVTLGPVTSTARNLVNGSLDVDTNSNSIQLILKGFAGQTANYIQLQDSGGSEVARIDSNGGYTQTRAGNSMAIEMGRSSGSLATPTVIGSSDIIGNIIFRGYSAAAAAMVTAASITSSTNGTPDTAGDTTDMPGALFFNVTPDGAGTPVVAAKVTENSLNAVKAISIGASSASLQTAMLAAENVDIATGSTYSFTFNGSGNSGGIFFCTLGGTSAAASYSAIFLGAGTGSPVSVYTGANSSLTKSDPGSATCATGNKVCYYAPTSSNMSVRNQTGNSQTVSCFKMTAEIQ